TESPLLPRCLTVEAPRFSVLIRHHSRPAFSRGNLAPFAMSMKSPGAIWSTQGPQFRHTGNARGPLGDPRAKARSLPALLHQAKAWCLHPTTLVKRGASPYDHAKA